MRRSISIKFFFFLGKREIVVSQETENEEKTKGRKKNGKKEEGKHRVVIEKPNHENFTVLFLNVERSVI